MLRSGLVDVVVVCVFATFFFRVAYFGSMSVASPSRSSAQTPPPRGGAVPTPPTRARVHDESRNPTLEKRVANHGSATISAVRNTAAAPTTGDWQTFFDMACRWTHVQIPAPRSAREAIKVVETLTTQPTEPTVFVLGPSLPISSSTTPHHHRLHESEVNVGGADEDHQLDSSGLGWGSLPQGIIITHNCPIVIMASPQLRATVGLAPRRHNESDPILRWHPTTVQLHHAAAPADWRPALTIAPPARVVVQGIRFSSPVHVLDGARAELNGCRIDLPSPTTLTFAGPRMPRRDHACIRASGSVCLRDCAITGGSVGIALCAARVLPVLVTKCRVDSCSTVGVWADGPSPPRIENCDITECGMAGIVISGTAVGGSVADCNVSHCTGYGVVTEGSAGAWLQRSSVSSCGEAAFLITGNSHPVIMHCAVVLPRSEAPHQRQSVALLAVQQASVKVQSTTFQCPRGRASDTATTPHHDLPCMVIMDVADAIVENCTIDIDSGEESEHDSGVLIAYADGSATVDFTANRVATRHASRLLTDTGTSSDVLLGLHAEWASIRMRATEVNGTLTPTAVAVVGPDTAQRWNAMLPAPWRPVGVVKAKQSQTDDDDESPRAKSSLAMAAFTLLAAAAAAGDGPRDSTQPPTAAVATTTTADGFVRPLSSLDAEHDVSLTGVRLALGAEDSDAPPPPHRAASSAELRPLSCPPTTEVPSKPVPPPRPTTAASSSSRKVSATAQRIVAAAAADEHNRKNQQQIRTRSVTPREEELLREIARLHAAMVATPRKQAASRTLSPRQAPHQAPVLASTTRSASTSTAFVPFADGCKVIRIGNYKWDVAARKEFLAGRLPLSAARYEAVVDTAATKTPRRTRPSSRAQSAAADDTTAPASQRRRCPSATEADAALALRMHDDALEQRAESAREQSLRDDARLRARRGLQLTVYGQQELANRLYSKTLQHKAETALKLKQKYLTRVVRPVGWYATPGESDSDEARTATAATPNPDRSSSRVTYVRRLTTPAHDEAERCARIADQLEDYRAAAQERRQKLVNKLCYLPSKAKARRLPRESLEAYCDSLYRNHRDPSISPRLIAAGAEIDAGFVERQAAKHRSELRTWREQARANRPPRRVRGPEALAAYCASLHLSHKDSNAAAVAQRTCPDSSQGRKWRPRPPAVAAPPRALVFVPMTAATAADTNPDPTAQCNNNTAVGDEAAGGGGDEETRGDTVEDDDGKNPFFASTATVALIPE